MTAVALPPPYYRVLGASVLSNLADGIRMAAFPLLANSSLLAIALLLLAGLPLLQPAAEDEVGEDEPIGAFDGVPFVRERPVLRGITSTTALLAAVDAAWFALLVLFVREQLGFGPAGFGLALAVGAVGGLAGAALADRRPDMELASVTWLVFGSTAVALIALGAVPTVATTIAALVITSAVFALWNVYVVSARQRATPLELLGRVGASYRTAVVLASMAGAFAGGVLADVTSVRGALVAYGALLLFAAPFAAAALRTDADQPGAGAA